MLPPKDGQVFIDPKLSEHICVFNIVRNLLSLNCEYLDVYILMYNTDEPLPYFTHLKYSVKSFLSRKKINKLFKMFLQKFSLK